MDLLLPQRGAPPGRELTLSLAPVPVSRAAWGRASLPVASCSCQCAERRCRLLLPQSHDAHAPGRCMATAEGPDAAGGPGGTAHMASYLQLSHPTALFLKHHQ